jgi:MoxR-like ATPase
MSSPLTPGLPRESAGLGNRLLDAARLVILGKDHELRLAVTCVMARM